MVLQNGAPLLADLFLHVYETDFFQGLLNNKDRKWDHIFNSSFRYLDDVLSLNNSRFSDYLHHIYQNVRKIKATTDTKKYASYFDVHIEIDNGSIFKNKPLDKCGDFTFPVVNYPFIRSDIPASPAYGVYISQLIRYSRACVQYNDFLDRAQLLTQKLLKQGYIAPSLKSSSLQKFYSRHHNQVGRYEISISFSST